MRQTILVLSGKGGVGKSTISYCLAKYLSDTNHFTGLLDLDLCGPSLACILGVDNASIIKSENGKWIPYKHRDTLSCISMAFLLSSSESAVIWRGARKNALIKEMCNNVDWGDNEYLIIDTPPGIQEEHITLAEQFYGNPNVSAVIVTTPHSLSIDDVTRQISFCHKTGIKLLGIVENMKTFKCPHCNECMEIFYSNSTQDLAKAQNLEYIGYLNVFPSLSELGQSRTEDELTQEIINLMQTILLKLA